MAVTDIKHASEAVEEVTARVFEAVSDNAEQVQQRASQLAGLAKDVSKSTAETGRMAVKKVGANAGRSPAPFVAGGIVGAIVLLLILWAWRHQDD